MTNSRIARTSLEPSRQVQTKEEDSEFELDDDGNKIEMDYEDKVLKRKKKEE